MIKFPSYTAAILTGAVVIPLFGLGWKFIDKTFHSQLLVLLWAIVTFLLPVLFSTGDMKYILKRYRESGFFRPMMAREDFRIFYIPAWKRMLVLFLSAAISMFVLKLIGVNL